MEYGTLQPFTYAHYRSMLSKAVDSGYFVSSFATFDESNPRTVILRHDVDYTLDGLLSFAEIEAELGCSAIRAVRGDHRKSYEPWFLQKKKPPYWFQHHNA